VSYLLSHGVGHLLVPLLEAYLVVRLMQLAASKVDASTFFAGGKGGGTVGFRTNRSRGGTKK
jgi:hypothetical protein